MWVVGQVLTCPQSFCADKDTSDTVGCGTCPQSLCNSLTGLTFSNQNPRTLNLVFCLFVTDNRASLVCLSRQVIPQLVTKPRPEFLQTPILSLPGFIQFQ